MIKKRTQVVYATSAGYVFRDNCFHYFVDLYRGVRPLGARPFRVESLEYGIGFLAMISDFLRAMTAREVRA